MLQGRDIMVSKATELMVSGKQLRGTVVEKKGPEARYRPHNQTRPVQPIHTHYKSVLPIFWVAPKLIKLTHSSLTVTVRKANRDGKLPLTIHSEVGCLSKRLKMLGLGKSGELLVTAGDVPFLF